MIQIDHLKQQAETNRFQIQETSSITMTGVDSISVISVKDAHTQSDRFGTSVI